MQQWLLSHFSIKSPFPFFRFYLTSNISKHNVMAKILRRCKILKQLMAGKFKWKDVKVWSLQISFVHGNERCFLLGTYGCLKQRAAATIYLKVSPYSLETDTFWHTQHCVFLMFIPVLLITHEVVVIENTIWVERAINTFFALFSTPANIQEACFQLIFAIISAGLF